MNLFIYVWFYVLLQCNVAEVYVTSRAEKSSSQIEAASFPGTNLCHLEQ